MESMLEESTTLLDSYIIPWGVHIISAALVFIIGLWVAKLIVKGAKRLMTKAQFEDVLVGFLGNMIYTVLLAVVIIATLEQLGVKTTSVLAVFATAGLAVGLALKDQLSNFAAGVMLIVFKPFTIGNFIEAGGTAGVVDTIRIFHTVLHTPDNREITVPNAQIFGGIITNVSARDTRRIDLVIGIGYDDDIGKARDILNSLISADDRILEDPAPSVSVAELGESSIDLAVRPWVSAADFWTVRSDLLEGVKREFDSQGISIPFPQRDLHVYEKAANA